MVDPPNKSCAVGLRRVFVSKKGHISCTKNHIMNPEGLKTQGMPYFWIVTVRFARNSDVSRSSHFVLEQARDETKSTILYNLNVQERDRTTKKVDMEETFPNKSEFHLSADQLLKGRS
jgi:hypothetical protein